LKLEFDVFEVDLLGLVNSMKLDFFEGDILGRTNFTQFFAPFTPLNVLSNIKFLQRLLIKNQTKSKTIFYKSNLLNIFTNKLIGHSVKVEKTLTNLFKKFIKNERNKSDYWNFLFKLSIGSFINSNCTPSTLFTN